MVIICNKCENVFSNILNVKFKLHHEFNYILHVENCRKHRILNIMSVLNCVSVIRITGIIMAIRTGVHRDKFNAFFSLFKIQ